VACPVVSGTSCFGAMTASDGTYTIGGLATGSYRVWFYDPSGTYARGYYGPGGFTPDYAGAAILAVPPDQGGIDVALPPGYRIGGTISAQGGGGLAGIRSWPAPRPVASAAADGRRWHAPSPGRPAHTVSGSTTLVVSARATTPLGFTPDYSAATLWRCRPTRPGSASRCPGLQHHGTVTAQGARIGLDQAVACPVVGAGPRQRDHGR
jgi:hypothetical protein